MRSRNIVWGLLFILVGVLLFAGVFLHADFISMHYLWPLFVLVPGLSFEVSYFTERKAPGLLIPGGILTTIGLLFLFEVFTHWSFSANTWPVYIIAIAAGLYQYYFCAGRPGSVLLAALILTAAAGVSIVSNVCHSFFSVAPAKIIIPTLFVIAGIYILFHGIGKDK